MQRPWRKSLSWRFDNTSSFLGPIVFPKGRFYHSNPNVLSPTFLIRLDTFYVTWVMQNADMSGFTRSEEGAAGKTHLVAFLRCTHFNG